TDVDGILRMNHLSSAKVLRVNSDLVIPVPVGNHAITTADLAPLPDASKPKRGMASVYGEDSDNAKIQRSIANAEANAPAGSPKIDLRDTSPRDDARRKPVVEGKDFTPPANREKVQVTMAMGDTLWKISQQYGVSVEQIKHWNGIQNHRGVQAGETITLYVTKDRAAAAANGTLTVASADPKAAAAATPSAVVGPVAPDDASSIAYKVKKGDTLWDIAREHNVDPLALMKENGLSRHSKIRPGDIIRIAASH
ncbi:MAG TPA: LysM peptidoglycan-binding domain-containing protein, partial [bacterium]|nr:LysM peptidoglycan-binding domain-containing protein [bacterium]